MPGSIVRAFEYQVACIPEYSEDEEDKSDRLNYTWNSAGA